jgi:hypothetical protein
LQRACNEAKDPVWLLRDFNCNLHDTDNTRLDAALGPNPTRSAEVQARSFGRTKLHRRRQGFWTWGMNRTVQNAPQHIRSVCDYILGPRTDVILAYRTRYVQWTQTDHWVIYVDLPMQRQQHVEYVRGRKKFPSDGTPTSEIDRRYAELIRLQVKQPAEDRRQKPNWISATTWQMIRIRQSLRGATDQLTRLRRVAMKRQICRHLKRDRQQSFDDEARTIKEAMANNSSAKTGFQLLQKWYKRKCGVKQPMSHSRLKTVAKNYEELYSKQQPALEMFSLEASIAQHFEVNDE